MQLFDDRFPIPPSGVSYDTGTATLINQIPYLAYANSSTHTGAWVHAQADILPYAIAALDTAWANGFLNQSTNLADYKIGEINIGWELPGMNIATVGIKDPGLVAYSSATATVENEGDDLLSVYPNPSGGMFTIHSLRDKENILAIEIYNVFGELVLDFPIPQATNQPINLSSQPNGMYFLECFSESKVERIKFIKIQ